MLWLLIILIILLTFLGLLCFHFEYLFFLILWTCCKKGANDLASLQNHSIFGNKLDIIDGFALKFVMIIRQNISYFQTLLSFRHNRMQSKRVFSFVVGFKMMVLCVQTHRLTRRWNMGAFWNSIQLLQHSVLTKC